MVTSRVRQVHAGHFTVVMATGIVATALHPSWKAGSTGLFWLALAVFAVMTVALIPAAVLRRKAAAAEGRGPVGDFGYFAYSAGGAVLAGHAAAMGLSVLAVVLMVLATVTWVVSSYLVVARRVVAGGVGEQTGVARLGQVDGTWLLIAVAPLAVTTAANGVGRDGDRDLWAVVATAAWGIGLVQLLLLGTLVAARLLLVPLDRTKEVAPYWVFMGIVALALFGGVDLFPGPSRDPVVVAAVIDTVAIVLWSFAVWLLPLMIAMSIWHARHDPNWAIYRPALWSMVFPVGVFAAASEAFGRTRDWGWMIDCGQVLAWVALLMWFVVVVMMLVPSGGATDGKTTADVDVTDLPDADPGSAVYTR